MLPALAVGEAEDPGEHLERGILDGRGDRLRGEVHLDVLVERGDDVVGPLGEREGAAGDEAKVARRRILAGQRGGNVVCNMRRDGCGRRAGEVRRRGRVRER